MTRKMMSYLMKETNETMIHVINKDGNIRVLKYKGLERISLKDTTMTDLNHAKAIAEECGWTFVSEEII